MKKIFSIVAALAFSVCSYAQLAWDTEFSESDYKNDQTVYNKSGDCDWSFSSIALGSLLNVLSAKEKDKNQNPYVFDMTDEEEEDDTLSSFAEVPLSPPQAARAMDRKIASRDCFAVLAITLFKPTITLFIPNFLILYSFFSSMCNFHTLQTSSIFIQQQSRKKAPAVKLEAEIFSQDPLRSLPQTCSGAQDDKNK